MLSATGRLVPSGLPLHFFFHSALIWLRMSQAAPRTYTRDRRISKSALCSSKFRLREAGAIDKETYAE